MNALAVRLIAGDGHRDAADFFHFLDLDVTVAEAEQFFPVQVVVLDDFFDDHLLGEALVIVEARVDMFAEERRQSEQGRFVSNEGDIGAAGEIEVQAAFLQASKKRVAAGDGPMVGANLAGGEAVEPALNALHEAVVKFVLVRQRFERLAAALGHFLSKLDHLIDRLLAIVLHDEIFDMSRQRRILFVGAGRRRISSIIGIMTWGQPSRISDRVPSKSKTTKRNRPRGMSRNYFGCRSTVSISGDPSSAKSRVKAWASHIRYCPHVRNDGNHEVAQSRGSIHELRMKTCLNWVDPYSPISEAATMRVAQYLSDQQITFEEMVHPPAFTAQKLAKSLHISGRQVMKSVLLKGPRLFLAVLPAKQIIELPRINAHFGSPVRLATVEELSEQFPGCEWVVLMPFGQLYGKPTVLEATIPLDATIVFEAERHAVAIRMLCRDYVKLERPERLVFAPTAWSIVRRG